MISEREPTAPYSNTESGFSYIPTKKLKKYLAAIQYKAAVSKLTTGRSTYARHIALMIQEVEHRDAMSLLQARTDAEHHKLYTRPGDQTLMATFKILDAQTNEIDYTGTVCAMGVVVADKGPITVFGEGTLEDKMQMLELLQAQVVDVHGLNPSKKAPH